MRTLSIGRHPDCDIVIADPTVSRRHAELSEAGGDVYMLTDHASTSGTYRMEEGSWKRCTSARVHSADHVRLGAFESTVADLVRRVRGQRAAAVGSRIERDPTTGQIVVRPR